MRDSAFLIYRALANIPEKPPKEKKSKEKEEEKKEKEEEKKENGDKEEGEGEKGEEEREKEERRKREEERKKRREEEEEEEKKEMVTKDSDLLLGCSYFDLSHCGYFETKVGLNSCTVQCSGSGIRCFSTPGPGKGFYGSESRLSIFWLKSTNSLSFGL